MEVTLKLRREILVVTTSKAAWWMLICMRLRGGKQPAQLLAVVQTTNNRACSLERLSENPKETWAVRTHSAKGVPPV